MTRPIDTVETIVNTFNLTKNQRPVDLGKLAKKWGVLIVEQRSIESEAMLLPVGNGYKVILKESAPLQRQNFSFAHELGHLLLEKAGNSRRPQVESAHRSSHGNAARERLCDKIAAEILMPRVAFEEDTRNAGWALESLPTLASNYNTSYEATAIRMIDLMPETCLVGVWRPPPGHAAAPRLKWSHSSSARYGVPRNTARRRQWLVVRGFNARGVQRGAAPFVDRSRKSKHPQDCPAEVLAYSGGLYRQALVFYYPHRQLSDDTEAICRIAGEPR